MATDQQTTKRPHGSSLSDFHPLKPAEEKLLECARLGMACFLNMGVRPADDMPPGKAREAITIRSEFLRFLAIGGDDDAPVHARGVQHSSAWIECKDCQEQASLDLDSCSIPHDLHVFNSIIDGYVTLMGAEARTLNFARTHILGKDPDDNSILADRLSTKGGLFLRYGFAAAGTVRLSGANIGGNLECTDGRFNGIAVSIDGDGVKTSGDVFLNYGFVAVGTVRLVGASINGDLDCSGGSFTGEDESILCDSTTVKGGSFSLMSHYLQPS